ncbi:MULTISPECIES: TetR/AcrR family transcriptional regulator [Microbacterium]|uniref:TetR/AcrR family transcriptional regulator n=1 Tax=Microbacterium marmarense TaxID=3122051 RepID=A0ABU8LUU6_9MICO
MTTYSARVGRPKASSREILAEAACELFLERGFEATSIGAVASRAGVSRSSFFNYFSSKSDILWAGFDESLLVLEASLEKQSDVDAEQQVRSAVAVLGADFVADSLALAILNSGAMKLTDELERESALRSSRIARAVADRFVAGGADRLAADIVGAAWGGAVLAAIGAWARGGAGRGDLTAFMMLAADTASSISLNG